MPKLRQNRLNYIAQLQRRYKKNSLNVDTSIKAKEIKEAIEIEREKNIKSCQLKQQTWAAIQDYNTNILHHKSTTAHQLDVESTSSEDSYSGAAIFGGNAHPENQQTGEEIVKKIQQQLDEQRLRLLREQLQLPI